MGIMDKFSNMLKINDEDDGYDEYDDDVEEPEVDTKVRNASFKESIEPERTETRPQPSRVTPMRSASKKTSNFGGNEVCVIKPTSVDESREITDTLLSNRIVVLNLEGLDMDIAQRIIDFTSGSTYAIDGNLQKISNYIFMITPKSVAISGDFQDFISSGNYNG